MKLLYSTLIIICSSLLYGQSYGLEWAKIHKPSSGGNSQGHRLAVDDSGYVYMAGTFRGNVDFDMGNGIANLTSAPLGIDVYVQKLDSLGNLIWVKTFTGSGDISSVEALAIDDSGSVYLGGVFEGTVDFDPGPGVDSKTCQSSSYYDAYIVKLNANGVYQWSATFASPGPDEIWDIEIDKQGNVLLVGGFNGNIDLDPSPNATYTISQNNGSYLVRLSPQGNFIWARNYGPIGQNTYARIKEIDVAENGNVFLSGYFNGLIDLDPGADSTFLTGIGTFLTKLDSSGNFIGAYQLSEGWSILDNMVLDDQGGVFVSGYFNNNTVDFDLGPGTHFLPFSLSAPSPAVDFFLAKFDTSGQFQWVMANGSPDYDFIHSLVVDSTGGILASGTFGESSLQSTLDFDPGVKEFNLTGETNHIAFRVKYDTHGNFLTGTALKSNVSIEAGEMAIDKRGYLYAIGAFRATVDFDPSSAVYNLGSTSYGERTFLQKLRPCNMSYGYDSIYACNSYTWIDGNTYFDDNNSASHLLTSSGGCDSLVYLNLTFITSSSLTIDSIEACGSYTWIDGVTYTSSNYLSSVILADKRGCDSVVNLALTIWGNSGVDSYNLCDSTLTWIDGQTYSTSNHTATHTITSSNGCDSVVSLDLTIGQSKSFTDVVVACDSYTWIDGITYTANDSTAAYTLATSTGCDSIVNLDLTLNQTTFGVDSIVACDRYTWIDGITYIHDNFNPLPTYTLTNIAGCDSVVSLSLRLNNSSYGLEVINACKSYTWINGVTYVNDTLVTDTVLSSIGCDSVLTLDLTVMNVDTSVSYNGTAMQANASNVSYQWIDCLNGFASINGANGQSFIPTHNGQYAVVLNNVGCIDTSGCFSINNVGLENPALFKSLSVSPNPNHGEFIIEGETLKGGHSIQFELFDPQGKRVYKSETPLNGCVFNQTVVLENTSAGKYFLRILLDNGFVTRALLIAP